MSSQEFKADWIDGERGASKSCSNENKRTSKSSSWSSLGVSPNLARALQLRGFKNPTPIQRSAIPSSLASPPRDIVGMARTGSGKTLAYLVPLLQSLGGAHAESTGIRTLILCPSRELAVQILKAGKDIARSLKQGSGEGHSLRWALVMGGESLDTQFESMSSKPDIVIATPGRFLHLVVEMDLDLRNVEMIIYDEADRLFEMGFELQLREILHRLPPNRHSLLFSATLPSSLAEFAKAGLNNPLFIRLDTEQRISPDLKVSFFSAKPDEKDAALLTILREVVDIPLSDLAVKNSSKAIIFVSTKHHVEYLSTLLQASGYRVSFIYGSLDQSARQQQLQVFRQGGSELLIVTDVAARGLDIPEMRNVINYDFPSGVRVFVHRVGRTARAGQQGFAWTLVTRDDMPYLADLEVFLDKPIISDSEVFGAIPRESIESSFEFIHQSLDISEPQLPALREVMKKGQSMFERSRSKASREAYKKVKAFSYGGENSLVGIHSVFRRDIGPLLSAGIDVLRHNMLLSVQHYSPEETVFEIGSRGQKPAAQLMRQRRDTLKRRSQPQLPQIREVTSSSFSQDQQKVPDIVKKSYRDPNFFLSSENIETVREKGYSLHEGISFAEHARSATLDLNGDEGDSHRVQRASQLKWDRRTKRFVKGDGVGADNKKMVRGESGVLLPATFKSGRYADWKSAKKTKRQLIDGDSKDQSELLSASSLRKKRLQTVKQREKNGRPRNK